MPTDCLLVPIVVDRLTMAPLWALVWPAPNLRTHLAYRESLEPKIDLVTAPKPGVPDEQCRAILLRAANGKPSYVSPTEAEVLASRCTYPISHAELVVAPGGSEACAIAKMPQGTLKSAPFCMDLLDPISPRSSTS
jgi:hypothetical protein